MGGDCRAGVAPGLVDAQPQRLLRAVHCMVAAAARQESGLTGPGCSDSDRSRQRSDHCAPFRIALETDCSESPIEVKACCCRRFASWDRVGKLENGTMHVCLRSIVCCERRIAAGNIQPGRRSKAAVATTHSSFFHNR